ncbi:hypothetical protein ACIPUC_16175 [Streptomyces sp. LARHCF249]
METATSLVIGQFAEYLRGLTERLDPGTGWYGEFLRRDPEGVRACLDGAAMPPWDVVESLLRDLAAARGEELAARESAYAARLRAAAVTAWDGLPGGAEQLRIQYTAAVEQRAATQAAVRSMTARLGGAADPAEADALARELSWTHDDAARATARHEDLAARLSTLRSRARDEAVWPGGPEAAEPLPGVPRQRPAPPQANGQERSWPQAHAQGPVWPPADAVVAPPAEDPVAAPADDPVREHTQAQAPAGRAEARWLRRGRRAGGARYAGSAAPEPAAFTPPPGYPDGDPAPGGPHSGSAPRGARSGHLESGVPAPRGARFGRPADGPAHDAPAERHPATGPGPVPREQPASGAGDVAAPPAGNARAVVAELIALRAQGRGGEAHALLCEIAAWPADRLPGLADQLARAGLAADWATLLWEAASLPPERLAAAAAALGESGREADCDRLLRQGVARPTAEIAEAALALGAAGRIREADALLGAFVRIRTAEEAAALARRDPQWFVPRLLQAAGEASATHRRDLVHALRVAGVGTA